MRLKIIYGLAVLLFLGACSQKNEKSYSNADAVLLKKVKTYRLNADGSIVTWDEKVQKLLTYRAFQSLFGDTHIFYNTDFQSVFIEKVFTTMADGKKVVAPQNGINDVLPGWCSGSKAYNHLRERIITHTALERNAVINAEWSVNTGKDVFPFLAGVETISGDCPVENYKVVVEVPEKIKLSYKLLNSSVEPETHPKDGFLIYTWQFSDVPQNIPESNVSGSAPTTPVLLFSTQTDNASVLNWLSRSGNNPDKAPDQALARIGKLPANLTLAQKILKVQEIVANEINTLYIPANLTGFKSATPAEVWQRNSATPFEKSALLATLIRSLGADAEVCIKYPSYAAEEQLPFHLLSEPLVKAIAGTDTLYLSATHINRNALEFCTPQTVIQSLSGHFKKTNGSQAALEIKLNGDLALDGDGLIKGTLQSEYRNAAVPWYALLTDHSKLPDPDLNSKATVKESAENKLLATSVLESKSLTVKRGDCFFVTLPESHGGSANFIPSVLYSDRTNPVALPCPISESYHVELQLPKNARLISPVKEEISNNSGSVKIVFSQKGNIVLADKQLVISKQEIKPEEYASFRQLMDKWHTPKFKELVIIKE